MRLDDHVFKRLAQQVDVIGITTGNKAGKIGGLPDKVFHGHTALEYGARLTGREKHMRMHDDGAHRSGHGNLLDARLIDTHGEYQATVQRRRDVIDVHRAAGDGLALHGELEQFELSAGRG